MTVKKIKTPAECMKELRERRKTKFKKFVVYLPKNGIKTKERNLRNLVNECNGEIGSG